MDAYGHARLYNVWSELKSHCFRRSSSEHDVIDASWFSINDTYESRVPDLACVEAIPTVVHERVELVVNLGSLLLDVYWLNWSVFPVIIQAIKYKLTKVVFLTNICIPGYLRATIFQIRGKTGIVSHHLETRSKVISGWKLCHLPRPGTLIELYYGIKWACAWPLSTIFDDGPFCQWNWKECHCVLIAINE